MTHEKMSVHEALATLKTLDKRINDKICEGKFITTVKHSATKIDGKTREECENDMKADFDSVMGLIARRAAIRKALASSNAYSVITVGDKSYRLSEAIEMKQHGIELKTELLNRLEYQYSKAVLDIRTVNEDKVLKAAESYVSGLFGNKDKANPDEVESARKTYVEAHSLDMLDPLKVKDKISDLRDEIDAFMSAIDSAISVSNALTTIEIEY